MTPYQREILVRTIMGEAANQGPEGWAAVAHVIRNRMADPRWPGDPAQVALQPKQFSAWNDASMGGNDLVQRGPDHPAFQKIAGVVDQVFAGQAPDPTGGATHYYAPQGMPGGREPKWFDSVTQERGTSPVTIGDHIFTGRMADGPVGLNKRPVPVQHPDVAHGLRQSPFPSPTAPMGQPMADNVPTPTPQPKPDQGFDWQGAMSDAGTLLSALGGGQQNDQQDAQQAALLAQSQRAMDEAAQRRRAWDRSFTWL